MNHALLLAKKAEEEGEVPVGAVAVFNHEIIAEGFNQPIKSHDPSAHAEVVALRGAAKILQNYRLPDVILYTTLEPCLMCAGLIAHARIKRCVFGAYDIKAGALSSRLSVFSLGILNYIPAITGGVLEEACRGCLTSFFQKKRNRESFGSS